MKLPTLGLALSLLNSIATAASTFSPVRPPAYPLAVKSPYLSTWLNSGAGSDRSGYLPGQWPTFWRGQVTGWTGIIRVDDKSYVWMGNPLNFPNLADQVSAEYTSTKSIFNFDIDGKVSLKVTFLSPVTPDDQKRQSLIFSYMNVEVASADGKSHAVQLYSDISAEFVSGNRNDIAQWDFGSVDDVAYHKIFRQTPMLFSEHNDQAEWGNYYYATDAGVGLTSDSGIDDDIRGRFMHDGKLANSKDPNFRAIQDHWPVFAFAVDLGSVSGNVVNTLFSLGMCQDQAVQFLGANGLVSLPPLWKSYFGSDEDALSFFHHDYAQSSSESQSLDDKISTDSLAVAGQDYLTITSLSTRQTFGAFTFVGNDSDPYVFLKEISSNGNTQTVDVIFPAHPILLYTNPTLLKLLLKPLFENQESGHYPNKYSIHDIGTHFPNATGHPKGDDEPMPLEECGNMLIMVLAYYQRTGDRDYLVQHYPILDQWTQYLVEFALYPEYQLSTDDFAGRLANQTNLALKGMIGIEAMATIAHITGNHHDARNYSAIAHDYIDQWQVLGINHAADPPHTTLNYGHDMSWGLLYNLWAVPLLNFTLIPDSVFSQQSTYYASLLKNPTYRYGLPLDTRHLWTKTDWELWAATTSSPDVRDEFHKRIVEWLGVGREGRPFTDLYEVDTGKMPDGIWFMARPVMGGAFAGLVGSKERIA